MTQYHIELRFDDDLLKAIMYFLSELDIQLENHVLSSSLGHYTRATQSPAHDLLADFGVEEPVLSELSSACTEPGRSNGLTPELVRAWMLYIQTQDLERPAGYLVNRLRAGQTPADVWMTLGRLSDEQRARLRGLAGHRKWLGDRNRDELTALGLDEEAAEAWYQANREAIDGVS